jgi:type I restriction enzyme S subunit
VNAFLQTKEYRDQVSERAQGTNIQNLRREHITSILMRIPPRAEQPRIADRIDELFTDLSAGVAALERVRKKLRRYRSAVLHAAVTGRLTADEPAAKLLERIKTERAAMSESHPARPRRTRKMMSS